MNQEWPTQNAETPKTTQVGKVEVIENVQSVEQLKKQTLVKEYLKEGVPHIVFNLIHTNIDDNTGAYVDRAHIENKEAIESIKTNGTELGGYTRVGSHANSRVDCPHLISYIDEKDKYSIGYKNCIGVIVVGRSISTGEEISFMTHQDSQYGEPCGDSGRKWAKMFDGALDDNTKELMAHSEKDTIDAVIFGGSSQDMNAYTRVINKMSQKITEKLGFEPVVLTGPGGNYEVPNNGKSIGPSTNIFFDTQKRKVYVLRLNTLDESRNKPYYALKNSNMEK